MAIRGGMAVDLLSPSQHQFQPEATARSLSNIARFAGNYGRYSVAQHAVLTAYVCSQHFDGTAAQCFASLHHDDVEMITNDIPKPVKRVCPDVGVLEARLNRALEARYQINISDPVVKKSEYIVFASEVLRLVPQGDRHIYRDDIPTAPAVTLQWVSLKPWSPDEAFAKYMDLHEQLAKAQSEAQVTAARAGGLH